MNSDPPKEICWSCKEAKIPEWSFCPYCGTQFRQIREPKPPIPDIDVKFLTDIYSFSWYNHKVGMVALYDAVANISHFYAPDVHERFDLVVEPPRAQRILRAKIFAESMAQAEAFGMLCLAVKRRKKQSMLWTYLNIEPSEVTQFFQQILNFPKPPSLQRLLGLPRISDIRKAIASDLTLDNPQRAKEAEELITSCLYDYTQHSENFVSIARTYLNNEGANVRIYNKIKHGFVVVEGRDWFTPPLDLNCVNVVVNDRWQVASLKMDEAEVNREIDNTHLVMITCAEIMALCAKFNELGILYK